MLFQSSVCYKTFTESWSEIFEKNIFLQKVLYFFIFFIYMGKLQGHNPLKQSHKIKKSRNYNLMQFHRGTMLFLVLYKTTLKKLICNKCRRSELRALYNVIVINI